MNDNAYASNGQAASTDALTFLRWLYGDDATGWLSIWTLPDKVTGWYPAHRLPLAAKYALSRATTDEVYFGLGLRQEQLKDGRGESNDVLAIPGFWIELDIKHAVHTKVNLPETIEQAIALVYEAIPLKPSMTINSGYGAHVHWLFRELWIFEDDADRQSAYHLLHRLQATIQAVAGVPGVIRGKFAVRKIAIRSPVRRQSRLHLKKQDVLLYMTSYTDRHATVLNSKTSSVTPVYRPL
jgi:hypothetical protein